MIAAPKAKCVTGLRDLFVRRGEGEEVSGETRRLQRGSLDNWMIK